MRGQQRGFRFQRGAQVRLGLRQLTAFAAVPAIL
jgi:hypothetical protein